MNLSDIVILNILNNKFNAKYRLELKKLNIINHKHVLSHIIKQSLKFEKHNLYSYKTAIFFKKIDIEKVLISNKISFGEENYKYFTGYLYKDHKVKPLHLMLPRASAYVKRDDGRTKWMYLLIEDKVSIDIKNEF